MRTRNPDYFLKQYERETRGRLKIYIGGAPGVGKTYQMLRDANEMKVSGMDIAIGLIETHGRKETVEQIGELETIPLKEINYKNIVLKEMDLETILRRRPKVVLVDELAHTNAPSSMNKKRYEDVLELLENGINVMTAVNIQHLESLNDYVNRMTGVKIRETIPDKMLKLADETEVIDISPEGLRERIKKGKVYGKDKIESALNNFFRVGNLTALRELSLREVANEVDEKLSIYKSENDVEGLVGALEKILVCVNLNFNAEYLIRRGYRIAKMLKAELIVMYVNNNTHGVETTKKYNEIANLCKRLEAKFIMLEAEDPAELIIKYAKENNITQIVIGQSARTRLHEIIKGSIVRKIMRRTKYVDVLVVADPKQ